ncbi:MAG: hypothetical protein MZV70_33620 [Desulfobacterales bacterium]|nr:hypothetical protein [Desulfobacterales bacterium]
MMVTARQLHESDATTGKLRRYERLATAGNCNWRGETPGEPNQPASPTGKVPGQPWRKGQE